MASLALRCYKQICTKTLKSSVPLINTLVSKQLRLFSVLPSLHQCTTDNDFDSERDAKLGDFSKYEISNQTIAKLKHAGIQHLFEVQYKTFEKVRNGNDVFVQARTGTGKTLGFALPILEAVQAKGRVDSDIFPQPPAALVIAPTRELAIQIAQEFEKFASPQTKVSCFYGGVQKYQQNRDLYGGIDILVGTPGRLLDHMKTGNLNISTVRHVVLDEADRMLDMGFQKDIEEIFSYAYTETNKPQTLLFSATLPDWVRGITRRYTSDNMQQFDLITSAVKSAVLVDHKAIRCEWRQHPAVVEHFVRKYCGRDGKALVFCQTKRATSDLAAMLGRNADYITGDKDQNQRERTLSNFKTGAINVLVATDVAARGLDIPKIDLVIQTGPPPDTDNYIHRAGRTGRAGKNGVSVVLYGNDELKGMAQVEKRAGIQFGDENDDAKLKAIVRAPGTRNDFHSMSDNTWGNSGAHSRGGSSGGYRENMYGGGFGDQRGFGSQDRSFDRHRGGSQNRDFDGHRGGSQDHGFDRHRGGSQDRGFDRHRGGSQDRSFDRHQGGSQDRGFDRHRGGSQDRGFNGHRGGSQDRSFDSHKGRKEIDDLDDWDANDLFDDDFFKPSKTSQGGKKRNDSDDLDDDPFWK